MYRSAASLINYCCPFNTFQTFKSLRYVQVVQTITTWRGVSTFREFSKRRNVQESIGKLIREAQRTRTGTNSRSEAPARSVGNEDEKEM